MNRLLLVVLALLLAALGWQTWRLADASQTISTQSDELQSKSQALAKSNRPERHRARFAWISACRTRASLKIPIWNLSD